MKNLKNLKKILIMLIMIVCICGIATISKATGNVDDLISDIPILNSEPKTTPTPTPTPTPSPTPSGNIGAPTNNNTTLPKTGVNDTAMWITIGVCTIVAIYTYKKVRDYNV